VNVHAATVELDGQVAGERRVLDEVALDPLALVAERHVELVEPMVGVDLHDVPQHRVLADLDHRLGAQLGLFGEARAEASGQDDDLHEDRSQVSILRSTSLF